MKKVLIAIGLVLLAVSGASAQVTVVGQTLYYKYVQTVDSETGVRSLNRTIFGNYNISEGIYFTFTRNSCYGSDEKGILQPFASYTFNEEPTFIYQGEQNNMFVYMKKSGSYYTEYFYFSKDYKRLNIRVQFNTSASYQDLKIVYVYEQVDPPKKEEPKPVAPTQMW